VFLVKKTKRKMVHKKADRFMQAGKRFLQVKIYATILNENHKRRKAAKEVNVRYNKEKGIK
jgi:hypothetical protein